MNKIDFCIECESKNIEIISKPEEFDIRGEKITVDVSYWHCNNCNEDFDALGCNDYLDTAYRMYRKKHNMLQPEEIKELRKKYGLKQGDLAKILGWGLATLSRYEKGALQDFTHDNMLKLLQDPDNLQFLLLKNPEVIEEEKYIEIINKINNSKKGNPLKDISKHLKYNPDIFNGFRAFNCEKLLNAVLFFCLAGTLKTKLNKLLFYADFKHYKKYTNGITGIKYYHERFGPVPKYYQSIVGALVDDGKIQINEIDYGIIDNSGFPIIGEEYKSTVEPDMSVFSISELETLHIVKQYFNTSGSKQISDFSHQEHGYKNTEPGEEISYKYAEELLV